MTINEFSTALAGRDPASRVKIAINNGGSFSALVSGITMDGDTVTFDDGSNFVRGVLVDVIVGVE